MNGVASTAPSKAVAPFSKPIVIDSVSPFSKSAAELPQPSPHAGRPSQQRDRKIDHVNAGGRQRPGRIDGLRQSPIVRRQFQEQILAEIALHQQRIAEFAGRKPLSHLDHGGLEPAFVADTQLNAGLVHGRNRSLRVGRGGAERLFAEHMASGRRGRDDLFGMALLRRRENDRLNPGVGQRILEIRGGLDAERGSGRARGVEGIDAQHGPDDLAVAQVLEDVLSPPAQTDNGGIDHVRLPLP